LSDGERAQIVCGGWNQLAMAPGTNNQRPVSLLAEYGF
jgi:hypothetical protein